MSTLQVRLQPNPHLPWDAVPVSAEIMNSEFEIVARMVMHGEVTVKVPSPGFYFVRARLPSGETTIAQTVIKEDESLSEVILHPSQSPHEWLSWQHFLGEVPQRESEVTLARFPSTWLRLWFYQEGKWSVQPASLVNLVDNDERMALYQLDLSEQPFGLWLLHVGGPEVPWRFVSISPTPNVIQILVRLSQTPTKFNGGLVVKVASLDRRAETLSYYLASGSVEAAHMISDDVIRQPEEFPDDVPADVEEAEQMLRYKLRNPYGAAVGGYYLLRVGDYPRLHDWPNNFANWVKWLPDAAVIHAWQLLYQADESERPKARARLLEATHRGLPVFIEGLRYLIDGLRLFAHNPIVGDERDEEVERALEQVRRYAAAADWAQRLTTFYGDTPQNPSLELKMGVPSDTESLLYLPMGS